MASKPRQALVTDALPSNGRATGDKVVGLRGEEPAPASGCGQKPSDIATFAAQTGIFAAASGPGALAALGAARRRSIMFTGFAGVTCNLVASRPTSVLVGIIASDITRRIDADGLVSKLRDHRASADLECRFCCNGLGAQVNLPEPKSSIPLGTTLTLQLGRICRAEAPTAASLLGTPYRPSEKTIRLWASMLARLVIVLCCWAGNCAVAQRPVGGRNLVWGLRGHQPNAALKRARGWVITRVEVIT